MVIELPYPGDRASLFAPLAAMPWAMWLDSGPAPRGGQDLMVAMPRVTVHAWGREAIVSHSGQPRGVRADPLALLDALLADAGDGNDAARAVGYFGYDMQRSDAPLASVPDLAFGVYDGLVRIDHDRRRCVIEAGDTPHGRDWAGRMAALLRRTAAGGAGNRPAFGLQGSVGANMDLAAYARAFHRVQDYIRAGDCYQVNLAMRFAAAYRGHPWPLYLALRRRNPAPYGAWLNLPFGQVLSSSPECFLELHGDRVSTRPIKGTRRRVADPEQDRRLAHELAQSEKDRAENLMIVDLLRNDLGKVCLPGSIEVPALFQVEHFATVHHLVSTVTGRLRPGVRALDVLAAAFPGGSITGAPKRRAREIIAELEPDARQVYCGAIGYLAPGGDMHLNIAIRTLLCSAGELRFWAGGGVVADSELHAEYQECLDKARATLETLQAFAPKGVAQT